MAINKKTLFNKKWTVSYDTKENFASDLRQNDKVVFFLCFLVHICIKASLIHSFLNYLCTGTSDWPRLIFVVPYLKPAFFSIEGGGRPSWIWSVKYFTVFCNYGRAPPILKWPRKVLEYSNKQYSYVSFKFLCIKKLPK